MREVQTESLAAGIGFGVGAVMYIVDFEDGASIEIPDEYLAAVAE